MLEICVSEMTGFLGTFSNGRNGAVHDFDESIVQSCSPLPGSRAPLGLGGVLDTSADRGFWVTQAGWGGVGGLFY